MPGFGIYVHFPWCKSLCPYCDFAVKVHPAPPEEQYARAVLAELGARQSSAPQRPPGSVYFGGGTPSLWDPRWVGAVLDGVARTVGLEQGAEITLEANPGTVDRARLEGYRAAGVNRLSLGAQSFQREMLAALGRDHAPEDTRRAVEDARRAGFQEISLDLIHGGPGEHAARAEADARAAAALDPTHVSLYALTLEPHVRLARDARAGRVALPGEDVAADAGEAAISTLEAAGLARYEISNLARPGHESRHNSLYWTGGEYLGLGIGAAGFLRTSVGGRRWTNHRWLPRYMKDALAGLPPEAEVEELSPTRLLGERMMTGLRLLAGVKLDDLSRELGLDAPARLGPEIDRLVAEGLLTRTGPVVRLTRRGLDLHSSVAQRFL